MQLLAAKLGCSEDKLRAAEQILHASLPKDYRDFLSKHDGGIALVTSQAFAKPVPMSCGGGP